MTIDEIKSGMGKTGKMFAGVQDGVLMMPSFFDRACLLIEPPLCINDTQILEVLGGVQHACEALCPSAEAA